MIINEYNKSMIAIGGVKDIFLMQPRLYDCLDYKAIDNRLTLLPYFIVIRL